MLNQSNLIVQKIWNYCNVLRDDGISYMDYVEQLTYLLFLKIVDEKKKKLNYNENNIPIGYDWSNMLDKSGDELILQYKHTLKELGNSEGTLRMIYKKAQNKIQDPEKLKKLILLIDNETWIGNNTDVTGDIYEGILQKNAEDVKNGAGQYFTPRPIINAIVEVMQPSPNLTICDPACGTGGFILGAYEYISTRYKLSKKDKKFLEDKTFSGWEIVDSTARLCSMNLYLHNIGHDNCPIIVEDALTSGTEKKFDIVLSNPPFGRKGSVTFVNNRKKSEKDFLNFKREDFWVSTSNKQLNFIQHIYNILNPGGRAAVIVPDNVLFEGGAAEVVRKKLLSDCNLHTILKLPSGIFYAQGVKANVVFFDKESTAGDNSNKKTWIYDLRSNMHFTLKTNQIKYENLLQFIDCYKPDNFNKRTENERFKAFNYEELLARDKCNLDISWMRDDSFDDESFNLSASILAQEIIENIQIALGQFNNVIQILEDE